jgi:hypothetical protein
MTHTLEAATYWRLRAICSEASLCEVRALQARADLATATKKRIETLTALGFDAAAPTFTLDDDALTIAFPETPTYPY